MPTPSSINSMVLLHGPNLNLLGQREPSKYGSLSLSQLVDLVRQEAEMHGYTLRDYQTNHAGKLVDFVHELGSADRVILNAGAWTHTSVALRDALAAVAVPYVEVHITQVHDREAFRHRSLLSAGAVACFAGTGQGVNPAAGYLEAVRFLARELPAC